MVYHACTTPISHLYKGGIILLVSVENQFQIRKIADRFLVIPANNFTNGRAIFEVNMTGMVILDFLLDKKSVSFDSIVEHVKRVCGTAPNRIVQDIKDFLEIAQEQKLVSIK